MKRRGKSLKLEIMLGGSRASTLFFFVKRHRGELVRMFQSRASSSVTSSSPSSFELLKQCCHHYQKSGVSGGDGGCNHQQRRTTSTRSKMTTPASLKMCNNTPLPTSSLSLSRESKHGGSSILKDIQLRNGINNSATSNKLILPKDNSK